MKVLLENGKTATSWVDLRNGPENRSQAILRLVFHEECFAYVDFIRGRSSLKIST